MSASSVDNQQRQKRIAIGGAVVLVALLAFQGPKLLGGSSAPSAAPDVATEQGATPAPRRTSGVATSRPRSLARAGTFQLKDPFVPRLGTRANPGAAAGTASSAGPSLLSASGRSYAESASLASSPGPSMLSGAPAVSPPEPTVQPPKPSGGGGAAGERYTVILSSISISAGRRAAERDATRFRRAGLSRVGILVSSRYRGLRAGYYVVYSGSYASAAAARQAAAKARGQARSAHAHPLRLSDAGL